MRTPVAALCLLAVLAVAAPALAAPPSPRADRALERALDRLVEADGGPPGAVSVVQRGLDREVHNAGVAEVGKSRAIKATDHMRIASAAKAFVGATSLALAADGVLSLDDTIGERLPNLPAAWAPVTLGQALNHTSGLPDYSASKAFQTWLVNNLHTKIEHLALIDFVKDEPLGFTPGTQYEYSNTDNIVAGLMIEAATGHTYERELADGVLSPLGLSQTSLPSGFRMPRPYFHGYDIDPPNPPDDYSEIASMSSLWAAGGIVSTPADLTRFIRGYVGRRLFLRSVQLQQFAFVKGESQPPGPGKNAAGMSVFRYRTRCGTLYGHTGNIFGYTQFMAATRNGKRSVTVSISTQLSRTGGARPAFKALRRAFLAGACAALARR
jgi:D-alanyl-D-alanine carboxypeptidase